MRILVAYNGSIDSKAALRQGIARAREQNGILFVLHVFPSRLFIDHELGPWAERMAKAESARYLDEARRIIKEEGEGIFSKIVETDGNPEEEIVAYAREANIDVIFTPHRYKEIAKEASCQMCFVPEAVLNPAAAV